MTNEQKSKVVRLLTPTIKRLDAKMKQYAAELGVEVSSLDYSQTIDMLIKESNQRQKRDNAGRFVGKEA